MGKKTCETCEHCIKTNEPQIGAHSCTRFPPVPLVVGASGMGIAIQTLFPTVNPKGASCGEYTEKTPPLSLAS